MPTQKAIKGSETETRELLGGTEENSVSSTRGHWFSLQAYQYFLTHLAPPNIGLLGTSLSWTLALLNNLSAQPGPNGLSLASKRQDVISKPRVLIKLTEILSVGMQCHWLPPIRHRCVLNIGLAPTIFILVCPIQAFNFHIIIQTQVHKTKPNIHNYGKIPLIVNLCEYLH